MNEKVPLVSVVMPAYNSEKYVGLAIESVVRQKEISDFEILAVDDGSSDDTARIVKEYASSDSRISYFYQENQVTCQ